MTRDPKMTSRIMSKIRSTDTKPEIKLRKSLWKKGLRYRKNYKKLIGTPDIVFVSKKVAVFVDGDFWHGNNWRIRKLSGLSAEFSKEKRDYWIPKIEKNIERDKRVNKTLQDSGWRVMRFWESDIKKDIQSVIEKILVEVSD